MYLARPNYRLKFIRENGRGPNYSYDKTPFYQQKNQKSKVTTQKRHKKLYYTTISDILRTVR